MSDAAPPPATDNRGLLSLVLSGGALFFILPSCCCGLWGTCTNTLGLIAAVVGVVLASGVKREVDEGRLAPENAGPYDIGRMVGFVAIGVALLGYLWSFLSFFLGMGLNALQVMNELN